jgi:cytochrome c553
MSFHPPLFHNACRAAALVIAMAAAMPALAQAVNAADPNLARNLAATCANCHGVNGNARGDMKPIAGMPADKLIAMLDDYKNGNQPATIMHQIAKGYTPEQIKLIAGYFAAKQPKK